MSGLCGICEPGRDLSTQDLGPMLDATARSGDSGRDRTAGNSAALGVARRWPAQAVAAVPGVRIAVDAELLNLRELRAMLTSSGLHGSALSLAEVLAHLYARRGLDFLGLLHGVFAIALWDDQLERLVLAIDRLGVKTLYHAREGSRLLFGSCVGGVRAALRHPPEIEPAAIVQFLLFSVVPTPLSVYRGVEKLPPGHCLTYEGGRVRAQSYWDVEYEESEHGDTHWWAGEVREALRSSVRRNVQDLSPERTGAYLSGGTDSSSVVAFMNEWNSPVNSFTMSFQDPGYSEATYAQTTAGCFRTRHHEKNLLAAEAFDAIPKIVSCYDEPFANSSAIAAYHCALLARENGIEVLLAGDGGDELFAGNERYAQDRYFALYHSLPGWLRRGLIEPVAGLLPANGSPFSLPRRYIRRAYLSNPQRILSYNLFLSLPSEEVFDAGLLAQVPRESWLQIPQGHFERAKAQSELNRLLYLDVKMTLADNDLRKVMGTAELAGVRVRFPLLDHPLVEFSARIPSELKLQGFQKRFVFKKAMEGILPRRVLCKKKHGFGVPVSRWLLRDPRFNSFMQDVLFDPRTRQRGYFRPEFLDRLSRLHRQDHTAFYGEVIWYLLVLELWHREHFERSRSTAFAR